MCVCVCVCRFFLHVQVFFFPSLFIVVRSAEQAQGAMLHRWRSKHSIVLLKLNLFIMGRLIQRQLDSASSWSQAT